MSKVPTNLGELSGHFQRDNDCVAFAQLLSYACKLNFLPAAKPTGHRTAAAVVVVVVGTTSRS